MKRKVWLLTAAALWIISAAALGGCSAYHKIEEETSGPRVEVVESQTEQEEGPTLAPNTGEPETVPSLEVEEEDTFNPEIILATDVHYFAKELTDFGQAYQTMAEQGDGKLALYVWEITDAFLDEVIERKPQTLILSGDLTLEGERGSHEALASKLERVKEAGIQVLVIPGNHDINNPKAAAYKGSDAIPVVQTTPDDFREIYGAFGYQDAISCDPNSLSYMAETPDGTWLLMLDSCQYENGNKVGGMIRTETYSWMEEILDQAWYEERNVIAVAHHNLLDESRIYEEDCTIEHSDELERFLDDWDVELFLSGHLHVQHYRTSEDHDIDEIVTGALTTSPCPYGVLNYKGPGDFTYHTEKVDVSSWAEKKDNPDTNLQNFEEYADEFLQNVFYRHAKADLEKYSISQEEKEKMAELYALMNVYATAGHAQDLKADMEGNKEYQLWQEYDRTDIYAMYLEEIMEDAVCDYNVFSRGQE